MIIHLNNPSDFLLNKFDLNNLCKNPSICIIGRRGSGKSRLINKLLSNLDPSVISNTDIIAPKEELSPYLSQIYPQAKMHYKYCSDIIEDQVKDTTESCLVLNDCCTGVQLKSELLLKMIYDGHHSNTTRIMTMQFPGPLAPEIRYNLDYIFICFDDSCANQRKLYDHYGGMFPSFNMFKQVFLQATVNFNCMVIAKQSGPNLSNKVFYFNAEE